MTESKPETAISPGEIMALRTHASPRFRKLLAQAIIDQAPSFARRQALLPVLCEPNPMNLEAQALIYQTEFMNPTAGAALEKQFAVASSQSLQVLMGLFLRNPAAPPPDVALCCRVGRQLWGSPVTGFLDVRQRGLTALAERLRRWPWRSRFPAGRPDQLAPNIEPALGRGGTKRSRLRWRLALCRSPGWWRC